MTRNDHSGVMSKLFLLLTLTGYLLGQSAWNTGDLSFDYQTFPFPSETMALSGDLISDEVPHEGVGGFELTAGDTNLVTLVAYDLYESSGDTLADIFVIFMIDSIPLLPGAYTVNPSPEALKMFVWLSEVDPESLAGLINASFTLDSLANFNPYISVSGEFEIVSLSSFHFEMNFSGAMVNTSIQVRTVSNGSIELWNTLPVSAYTQGSVSYTVGSESGNITGILNPLTESEGAGALLTQVNDTLMYNFISYTELPDQMYDVFGAILTGEEADFPLDGSLSQFNVSLLDDALPNAIPYMIRNVSQQDFLNLLQSTELPSLDQFSQLYLPVSLGSAFFSYSADGNAQLEVAELAMANSSADMTTLSMTWSLNNNLILGISDDRPLQPALSDLVGVAYPNPFNSSTIIPIQIAGEADISLRLYNLRGQEVHHHSFGHRGAGAHDLILDLGDSNLGGGLFFYSIQNSSKQIGNGSFVYLK